MIIECLNEALDFLGLYGPKVMPIPWLTCHQQQSFFKANPQQHQEDALPRDLKGALISAAKQRSCR